MLPEPSGNSWHDWYIYNCGVSEVPSIYNEWCAISAIAAVAGDDVWLEWFPGKKLLPNLFTMLLGPSGSGKDVAIDWAIDLLMKKDKAGRFILADEYGKPLIADQLYYGKATIQYLLDKMGGKASKERERPGQLYLVTPELTSSISAGNQAADFIRVITDLYTSKGRKWEDGTRTKGNVEIENPLVNWLAGTTLQWLVSSVPYDALEGGFVGRVAIAEGYYDFSKRVYRPWRPRDYNDIERRLLDYLLDMKELKGAFEMDSAALSIDEAWYHERENPSDESLGPAWMRQHTLILKVAMSLSLMDSLDGIIKASHVARAQKLVEASYRSIPKVNSLTGATPVSRAILAAEVKIREAGAAGITRSALTNYMSHGKNKISASQLDRDVLSTLISSGKIMEVEGEGHYRRTTVYVWKPPRLLEESDDEET